MAAHEPGVLFTTDGVRLSAVHHPAHHPVNDARGLAYVVAHGFTGTWRRPAVRLLTSVLSRDAGVVAFDFRGHGGSAGLSTVGDREVLDLDAAVRWARALGYRKVVTVGFSMGGSVVLRHAGLKNQLQYPQAVDAVVAVSAPARWYYRGTPPMRRLHYAIGNPMGRAVVRHVLKTRVDPGTWDPIPAPPWELAARIAPTPLLVVHGDNDHYFPLDHPHQIFDAAREPKDLWIEPGMGHAETAVGPELLARITAWVRKNTA